MVPFQWVSDTIRIAEKQGTDIAGLWRNPAFVVLMSFGDVTAQVKDSALSIVMTVLTGAWIGYLIFTTVRAEGAGPVDIWSGTTLRPTAPRSRHEYE